MPNFGQLLARKSESVGQIEALIFGLFGILFYVGQALDFPPFRTHPFQFRFNSFMTAIQNSFFFCLAVRSTWRRQRHKYFIAAFAFFRGHYYGVIFTLLPFHPSDINFPGKPKSLSVIGESASLLGNRNRRRNHYSFAANLQQNCKIGWLKMKASCQKIQKIIICDGWQKCRKIYVHRGKMWRF